MHRKNSKVRRTGSTESGERFAIRNTAARLHFTEMNEAKA